MSRKPRRRGPPQWLAGLLARLVPDGAVGASSVLGDLCEEYRDLQARRGTLRADGWYLRQVVTLGFPWLMAAAWGLAVESLSGFWLDLRASLRGLRRQPGLVVVAVLSLALGAGLVTAAATVVNGAWYAPLPWADAERMVDLGDSHPTEVPATVTPGVSTRSLARFREDLPPEFFERLEGGMREWVSIEIGSEGASNVRAVRASSGYASLLEFEARIGRLISESDLQTDAEPVVVLTHPVWRSVFGESDEVIGRTVAIDGVGHTVIGVLRADVRALEDFEVLLPLAHPTPDATFSQRGVQVIGVLREGVSVEAAAAAVASLASAMYADVDESSPGWSATVTPLRTVLARRGLGRAPALAFAMLCLAVLLVTTLNLAALLLARTTNRARELGVRAALGAGTAGLARAGLMDGLLLTGAGGLLGLGIVFAAREVTLARFAAEFPSWASFPIDLRVLAASVLGTAFTALIVGLLPLLRAVAIGKSNGVARAAAGQSGRSSSRAQNLLLGSQIVVALVLVAASAGALRTFSHASDFDRLGYRWEGLTGLTVMTEDVEGVDRTVRAAERLTLAAARNPAVDGHTTSRPLSLAGADRADQGTTVRIGGAQEPLAGSAMPRRALAVGPGYFDLNRIPIRAGRPVNSADVFGAPPAVVVSEDAARTLWPDRAPESVLGETLELSRSGVSTTFTVVGVAAAVILDPTENRDRTSPRIYPSILQTPDALYGAARTEVQLRVGSTGAPPTRRQWAVWLDEVMPGASLGEVTEVGAVLRQWVQPIRVIGWVLAGLALLVLALVALGIYGSVSYRIATHRREIGIRLALGADSGRVVRAVVGPLARIVSVATGLGVVLALLAQPVLEAGGIPVGRMNAPTLAVVVLVMVAAASGASWGPIRRALTVDPSRTLHES